MGRIIPWDLPKVNGGSIGGYTPDPTPDPPAPVSPYTLDDATFTLSNNTESIRYYQTPGGLSGRQSITVGTPLNIDMAIGSLSITTAGVVINDTSAVAQIIAHCKINAAGTTITIGAGSYTKAKYTAQDATFDVDITAAMVPQGGVVAPASCPVDIATCNTAGYIVTVDAAITSCEITSIDVYNGAGVVLQSWTPEAEE